MLIVPALIRSGTESNASPNLLAKQWRIIYENGKTQNPPIAAVVASAFFYLSWSAREGGPLYKRAAYNRSGLFAAAGGLVLAIVPFTILTMASTNNLLISKAKSVSESSVVDLIGLLKKWAALNLGRGVLPLLGCFCEIGRAHV